MAFPEILGAIASATHGSKIGLSRSGPAVAARLALELSARGRTVLLCGRNAEDLADLRGLLTLFSPEFSHSDPSLTRAQWERRFITLPPHPPAEHSRAGWAERMAALYSLRNAGSRCNLLLAPDNLLLRLPPLDIFDAHEVRLVKGQEMAPELVLEQAVDWGYQRVPMVASPGEIAMRGDILDIFCPGYAKALRLEFFGDILEDIRLFDPVTQRSVADLAEMVLLPVSPAVSGLDLRKKAQKRWAGLVKDGRLSEAERQRLEQLAEAGGNGILSGMYYEKAGRIEEWIPKDTVLLLPGESAFANILEDCAASWRGRLEQDAENGLRQLPSLVMRGPGEVLAALQSFTRVHFEDLPQGLDHGLPDLPERAVHGFQELFPGVGATDRPWQSLMAGLRDWTDKRVEVLLSFASERGRAKFAALAAQDGIVARERYQPGQPGLYALISPFRRGLALPGLNLRVLGEDVLQPRAARSVQPASGAFKGLERYDDLSPGDLLVHRDYGIAAFGGLKSMCLGNVLNDYLVLNYAGEDRLYLPVDRLSLVQRFKGQEGAQPVLDRLGGAQWVAGKEKARKAIEKIAGDLVAMYAYRKVAKGFGYSPPDEMYREFEASFGFEETPDQARAIEDVLADMEKPEPMDRLVCGDVGFGKTEVALRAAFRAASEGRQVALLCPTTVLAEQHFQTFRARMAGFPINVGLLSRFVAKGKQKETLEQAEAGRLDVLIGTHRLLSGDVNLPKLGLLILDEEQRFGVRHKERLKELRKNVDVLTLTATPIPRTLQLSLSGIRELSVMESAPPDRKPVATALIEKDDAVLKSVLERELARKGQVFWVYNRVQGLERVAEYVRMLAPTARVGLAHGQMGEKELEDSMRKFWHGDLDVLVCTAIIESGLDFPQANTLVVDQAQMFGLGQLYQLRGRVGRSDRQAFAVFIANNVDKLPEITRKRLRIILDLDYLGAGFQVAMEDLRLRGAGNILGESQSGHMNRLGLDLFLEMLEQEVAKLRGKPLREEVEPELNIGVPARIPESYIADARERLRYYKNLSSAPDAASRQDVEFELRDRFGPMPDELRNFLAVLSFKRVIAGWGALKADIFADRVKISFGEKNGHLDPARLVAWISAQKGRVRLQPPATLEVPAPSGSLEESLETIKADLGALMKESDG